MPQTTANISVDQGGVYVYANFTKDKTLFALYGVGDGDWVSFVARQAKLYQGQHRPLVLSSLWSFRISARSGPASRMSWACLTSKCWFWTLWPTTKRSLIFMMTSKHSLRTLSRAI